MASPAVLISIPMERFKELERAERALKAHLCEYEMADWLACAGHQEGHCEVCENEDKGNHRHALATRLHDLEAASRALASKLHEVHAAGRYKAVWAIAQSHLGPYDGPQYAEELARLDHLLPRADEQAQAGGEVGGG